MIITYGNVRGRISEEEYKIMLKEDQNLLDGLNDAYINVFGKSLEESNLRALVDELPQHILFIGQQWGFYDTEFREAAYIWLKNRGDI